MMHINFASYCSSGFISVLLQLLHCIHLATMVKTAIILRKMYHSRISMIQCTSAWLDHSDKSNYCLWDILCFKWSV